MEKINSRLLSWASVLDERTREQALRTSSMLFVFPHLALMPDAHLGKGATVGSVIPTAATRIAQHHIQVAQQLAYSRAAARRTFTHEQLRAAMVGIEFRDTEAFLDEIPAAYKDIDQVMADAAPLVQVRHTLRQLVNVKGT